MALTIPLCTGLAVYAAPLVGTVYGSSWLRAASIVPALCVLGGVRVVLELAYDYLAAIGLAAWNLRLQALWLVLLVPALAAGALWRGVEGVALAHAAVALVVVTPLFCVVLGRSGVSMKRMLTLQARPVLAGVAVLGTGLVAQQVWANAWLQIAAGSLAGLLLMVAVLRPLVPMARSSMQLASAEPAALVPAPGREIP
jgi:PST family polysaccharide transporter